MPGIRKQFSSEFKVRVALEAIKGQKTANEIASEYGVHPTQIAQWKKQALDELPNVFERPNSERVKSEEALIASLYQQIGQLKVEVDFLKKKPSEQKSRLSEGGILREADHVTSSRRHGDENSPNVLPYYYPLLSPRTASVSRMPEASAACSHLI